MIFDEVNQSLEMSPAATRRTCMVDGCNLGQDGGPYMTLEGLPTHDAVLKDYELHIEVHRLGRSSKTNLSAKSEGTDPRPDRFPRPEISDPATDAEWSYFIESWNTYKRATNLVGQNICDQLWHCPSESLKIKVFNSGIRATNTETEILDGIKKLCVKRHNNLVNILRFHDLQQDEVESIQQFAARLNGAASTCNFTIKCKCDNTVNFAEQIQSFQLIRGLADNEIQEKLLAETAAREMTLNEIIKHCEAIEAGKRSCDVINKSSNFTVNKSGGLNKISANKNQSGRANKSYAGNSYVNGYNKINAGSYDRSSQQINTDNQRKCAYCGDGWHVGPNWKKSCKAANVNCNLCGKIGHLARVCRSRNNTPHRESNMIEQENPETPAPPQDESSEAFGFFGHLQGESAALSHIGVNKFGKWTQKQIEEHPEVQISVRPDRSAYTDLQLQRNFPEKTKEVQGVGLADTGAQMVVMGPGTIHAMGMRKKDLIPVEMKIKAANMGGLKLLGGLPVIITGLDELGKERETKQLAYIAENVERIFLSKEACRELGIISKEFPLIGAHQPGNKAINEEASVNKVEIHDFKLCPGVSDDKCNCPIRELPPEPPLKCPFPPTVSNISKLENWIRETYRASSFNTCNNQALPLMKSSPPLELFIDKEAKPVACHKAAQIPVHFKQQVENEIRRDVKLGVLEEVPPNTPTTWCSRMCIQTKKNGKPRRVIDLQPINKHAVRQMYVGESPFEIVNEVPIRTYRTTVDAWNGYHSVPIREEDRHITTFITPWGRFRYRTTPQGFLAAQDAYNHRFDLITRDFQHKKRCVDDSIIWGNSIEEIFMRTCEYLSLTGNAGIIMNPEKFKFAKRELEFLGFELKEDSIEPGKDLIESIRDFPRPKDLTSTRSWFGLIEQVAWAFSKTKVMEPLRHLLKPKSEFVWTQELNDAFENSKKEILKAIETGVKTFKPDRVTCLATDWSKEGVGFCLLQKRCHCTNMTPICCTGGWELTFCNSRYTTPAESRYAPIEGECLAVAWGLKKARYFVAGCKDLIVATDHKPLLGILNDKELDSIDNGRLVKLKQKTLTYRFDIVHVPGIKQKIADATSRYPVGESGELNERLTRSITRANRTRPDDQDIRDTGELEKEIESEVNAICMSIGGDSNCEAISMEDIAIESTRDKEMMALIDAIRNGLSEDETNLPEQLSEYKRVRGDLCEKDGVALYKGRVVIPKGLRAKILDILHGAHQGCSGMWSRAALSVWWPGLCAQIEKRRAACGVCTQIAPSQPSMPPVSPERPEYPMQRICSDIAYLGSKTYIVIVDRYTNWPSVYPADGARGLTKALRYHFVTYGAAEELSSDGGPEYMATETQEFLRRWRVKHRISSAYYPKSNLRAELGVKVIKRLLRENIGGDGNLDTDKVARALLGYRNTPNTELGRSPAQLLYGRILRDYLPGTREIFCQRTEWIMLREERENALSEKYGKIKNDLERKTRRLKELMVGDIVQVQNQRGTEPLRWKKSGIIVEKREHDQYVVRMDGSGRMTLRNRKFIRGIEPLHDRDRMEDAKDLQGEEASRELPNEVGRSRDRS